MAHAALRKRNIISNLIRTPDELGLVQGGPKHDEIGLVHPRVSFTSPKSLVLIKLIKIIELVKFIESIELNQNTENGGDQSNKIVPEGPSIYIYIYNIFFGIYAI